jgi:Neugrin
MHNLRFFVRHITQLLNVNHDYNVARRTIFVSPKRMFSALQHLQLEHSTYYGRHGHTTSVNLEETTLYNPVSPNCNQDLTSMKSRSLLGQTEARSGKYRNRGAVRAQPKPDRFLGSGSQSTEDEQDGKNRATTKRGDQGISRKKLGSSYSSKRGAILEISIENIDALVAKSLCEESEMGHKASELQDFQSEASDLQPKASNLSSVHVPSHCDSPYTSSIVGTRKPSTVISAKPKPARTPVEERRLVEESLEPWQVQKIALKKKFPEGWNPRKRLSPDALAGIRAVHSQFPEQYTTRVLAKMFEISPEAIRRILKSRWSPKEEEELDRQRRWFSRGQTVWSRYAELGLKPPARWRQLGIGKRLDGTRRSSKLETNITIRGLDYARGTTRTMVRGESLANRIL